MKPDPRIIEFGEKLVALMKEYGADFELREETSGYETYADGMDINLTFMKDRAFDGYGTLSIDGKYIDATDITKVIEGLSK